MIDDKLTFQQLYKKGMVSNDWHQSQILRVLSGKLPE